MKTKLSKYRLPVTQARKRLVPGPTEFVQKRVRDIQINLRMHYANLEQLFAFASGEQSLPNPPYARRTPRTLDDDKRLQWTVQNLQEQITQLHQEFFQLIRSNP